MRRTTDEESTVLLTCALWIATPNMQFRAGYCVWVTTRLPKRTRSLVVVSPLTSLASGEDCNSERRCQDPS